MNVPEPDLGVQSRESDALESQYTALPISVIARGERRLDAEKYLTGGFGLRAQIEATLPYWRLDSLAQVRQPNRLKGTLVAPQHGLPFYTATQVFDIRPVPRKWLAPSKIRDLAGLVVERDWLLVTRSGSVGDTIMTFASHLGAIISDDLLRVQAHDSRFQGLLYVFLRSNFGRTMLLASKYGSIVKHLERSHLAEVPVPVVDDVVVDDLAARVRQVFQLREEAFHLTREAEVIYSEQFPPITDEDSDGYVVPARRLFSGRRRLDAYHYNPTAQGIERRLTASSTREVDLLANLAERILLPNRFKRIYMDGGVPYLDSEDVFKVNPRVTKFVAAGSASNLDSYTVERGWVLIARSGQIYGLNGSAMIANEWHEGKIISEHIIRVVPRADIRAGYLAMALGHPTLGRPLILRLAFGSSVPEIAVADLGSVPISRLGGVEDEIADRVEYASMLRMEADGQEDAMVQELEQYLEYQLHGRHRGWPVLSDETDVLSMGDPLSAMVAKSERALVAGDFVGEEAILERLAHLRVTK